LVRSHARTGRTAAKTAMAASVRTRAPAGKADTVLGMQTGLHFRASLSTFIAAHTLTIYGY